MHKIITWITRIALGLSVTVGVGLVALLVYQQISDGPTGPLMGGSFSSGEIVETPVEDWSELAGGRF